MTGSSISVVGGFVGQHVLGEFGGIDPALLDDADFLCATLRSALHEAGATVCEVVSKRFLPQGVTVVALLSESHASVHTYPEVGSVFLDVFTCGSRANPELAMRLLADALGAGTTQLTTIRRGRTGSAAIPTPGADDLGSGLSCHEQEAIR